MGSALPGTRSLGTDEVLELSYAQLRDMTHQELLGILRSLNEPASPKNKEEALTALVRYAR